MKCSDCENLIHCVGYPNENLTSNHILYCNNSNNQFCSVEAGGCIDDFRECNKFGLQNIDCQVRKYCKCNIIILNNVNLA